jgi:hypothetical protein
MMDKNTLLSPLFVLLSFLIVNIITAGEDTGRLKWEYAAVVFIESGKTIAEDRHGDVILERMTGKDDADVIQAAVEAAGPAGEYVLYAEDSEVIFKNNVISNLNLQVCLKGVRNSIIADNRFDTDSDKPAIFIGGSEGQNSRNILVTGNIFFKSDQDSAVAVEKLSAGNIVIRDNMLGAE